MKKISLPWAKATNSCHKPQLFSVKRSKQQTVSQIAIKTETKCHSVTNHPPSDQQSNQNAANPPLRSIMPTNKTKTTIN